MRLARRRIAGKRNNPVTGSSKVNGVSSPLPQAAWSSVFPPDRQRVRVVQTAEGNIKIGKCNVADSEQIRSIGW